MRFNGVDMLLVSISLVSLMVMIERALFFRSIRANVRELARQLDQLLRERRFHDAAERMRRSRSAEAAILLQGLVHADLGPASAEKAIAGAVALERKRMERGLAFLGTVGSNAPFIGLLGTVLGVIDAFKALGTSGAGTQAVMAGISQALVATAVGLVVAIPAVAAYNYFTRRIQSTLAESEALNGILLAHLLAKES